MNANVEFLTVLEVSVYGTNTKSGGFLGYAYTRDQATGMIASQGIAMYGAGIREQSAVRIGEAVYILRDRDPVAIGMQQITTIDA